MKATVIIEQGLTKVVLKAENDFERDIVEKIKDYKSDYEIETTVSTNYQFQTHNNHKIELSIKELQQFFALYVVGCSVCAFEKTQRGVSQILLPTN